MYDFKQFYIDGTWIDVTNERETINVINPADQQLIGQIAQGTHTDVDRAVAAAKQAFETFSQTSQQERVELLRKIADIYRRRMPEIAEAITHEMGAAKSLAEGDQAEAGLGLFESSADILENFIFEEATSEDDVVVKEPIGVCAMITPWNWPIHQLAAKVAPAIAVGCTCVLKPSEVAPLSAHIMADILHEAGLPAGVFNLVDGDGPGVGAVLAAHPDVDMVSFTGSTRAGIEVAKLAAPTVKRVAQELGGKSANIILDDADFDAAVRDGTDYCMSNVGQSCDAPTRMLVPHAMMERAAEVAANAANALVVGDPQLAETDQGPITYEQQYHKVRQMIQIGIDEGAALACGGLEKPDNTPDGFFVKPTVFSHVIPTMTIAKEEIFGPVICLIGYEDEEDAIRIANDTPYGLAAYLSSSDKTRARRVADRLRAGKVAINYAVGDLNSPFGGYKQSGNGREIGAYGFEDFLEVKAILGCG